MSNTNSSEEHSEEPQGASEENAATEQNVEQHDDADQHEQTPSHKKRLGPWGWLLVIVLILAAIIGLTLPRLDRNSEIYQRATSVPYVGDYVATFTGGSTNSSSSDSTSEQSSQDGSSSTSTSSSSGETAQEQVENAQDQMEEAGDSLTSDVNADVASTNSGDGNAEQSSDANSQNGEDKSKEENSTDGSTGSSTDSNDAGDENSSSDALSGNLEEQNEQLKAQVEELQKELEGAEAGQSTAQSSQAISNLQIAAISGMSLEGAISDAEAQGIEVPEEVKAQISGVPTAIDLQNEYGYYATQALRAAKIAESGDGLLAGIRGRFEAEYIGRSLTPQQGNTPNAVLSRAEESLRNGNLEQCLSDIATLPSEAQEAMAPWTEQANSRLNVLKSIETLLESSQAN